MRWRWAAVLVVSALALACGGGGSRGGGAGSAGQAAGSGGSASLGGRGGQNGRGGQSGQVGQGGTRVDGGAPDVPLSTGTFPYPGRWWASLAGLQADGGVALDRGPFVLHWSENDPADRNLWTAAGVYPLAASSASDGSTTLRMEAPGTSGCWSIYATADVHSLQAQPCNQPPSSGAPPLGFFNDVPRLLAEIPVPPLGPSSNLLLTVNAGTTGAFDGGGDWTVFSIGQEIWYWRADIGHAFDAGRSGLSGPIAAAASPDGRWLLFLGYPSNPGDQFGTLYALDTLTGNTTPVARSALGAPTFSPDGRRAAVYANAASSNRADLQAYELATGQTTTLAPHAYADSGVDATVAFLASGDRVVFAAYDATMSFSSGSIPMYAYDFAAGATMSFGNAMYLTPFPGQAYVALQAVTDTRGDGQIVLLHDEPGFAPKKLAATDQDAALWPDPTGAKLAYVTGGVLNIASVSGGTPVTLAGNAVPFNLVVGPPRPEFTTPDRPVAAWFSSSGGIVHQVLGATRHELHEDDPASHATTAFQIPDGWTFSAVSALGDVVLTDADSVTAIVWPNPPVDIGLGPGSDNTTQEYQAVHVFSANDRYLTYQVSGSLKVHDFAGSMTTQLAQLQFGSRAITSPKTGVSVVWLDANTPMKAYAPDGSSWPLPGPGTAPLMNPSGTAMGYEGPTHAAYIMHMEAGAIPTIVGNGAPVDVTDTQIVFRDLDGVCAVALP